MKRISDKGATLIELVIGITIFSVIILASSAALDFGFRSFDTINNNGSLQTEAQNIMLFITSQVRQSQSLTITTDIPPQLKLINSNGDTVRFVYNSAATTLTFFNDTQSTSRVLSSNVSASTFSNPAAGAGRGVDLSLSLSVGNQSYSINSSIYRRLN